MRAQKSVRDACAKHVIFPTTLQVALDLDGNSGTPLTVTVRRPDDETSLGACVARTLRLGVRVPSFSQPHHPVTWRIDVIN